MTSGAIGAGRVGGGAHRAATAEDQVKARGAKIADMSRIRSCRHDERMWRRPETHVETIDFVACRAVFAHERRKVANFLGWPDPLENECGTRIEASRFAVIRDTASAALRRKADADELLRRPTAEPPEPALLARRAVMAFTGRGAPRLGALLAAYLDDLRPLCVF